jgi:hypothetical protein
MNREDLKPDGYGKYHAYYKGMLVPVVDLSVPTIEIRPGEMITANWGSLSDYAPPPPPVITLFDVQPSPVVEGEMYRISWDVTGSNQIYIEGIGWSPESGSASKRADYCELGYGYRSSVTIRAHNEWGEISKTIDLIVTKKPKIVETDKPVSSPPVPNPLHVCPEHPTVEDAQYHAQQIDQEIESFLSDLHTNASTTPTTKENKNK